MSTKISPIRSSSASGSSVPAAASRALAKLSANPAISSRLAKTTWRSCSLMSGWPGMRVGSEGTTGGRRWSALPVLNDPDDVLRAESSSARSEMRRTKSGRRGDRRDPSVGEGGLAKLPLPRPRPVLMTWSAICAMSA